MNEVAVEPRPSDVRTVAAPVDHHVIIIGAGFGGMGVAIQLRRRGIDDLLIIDREDGLGGTWHINTYPGIAVDIASVTYSFSFEPNPDWSRLYAPGAELKAYAEHVADTYDLRRHMCFDTAVTAAAWDEDGSRWLIDTADGQRLSARVLIVGTGFLSQPKFPAIPGLEDFAGTIMHTAMWDHDHDLTGERVAVIGTGATAVQLIPEIAPYVAQLYVHQRTPIWVTPKLDGPIPRPLRAAFRRLPLAQLGMRLTNNTVLELLGAGVLYHKQFPLLIRAGEALARAHLRRQVRDPETRRKLTPDYDLFCKRPTFSNTYFPTFNRDDVELVTEDIERITPRGILTADGVEREIDTLLLATGFKLMEEGNYPPFPVTGVGGSDLGKRWRTQRFSSYEGLTVSGFPNLLYLPSPYAFSGLSFFFTIENQMAHIDRLLGEVERRGVDRFEVTEAAQDRFMQRMLAASANTLWVNGDCANSNSYYFNEHGDTSLGRLTPTFDAVYRARRFPLGDYLFG
ncbi:NAD(P)/FAD-dependent oxidoreductase [soil metagenome]